MAIICLRIGVPLVIENPYSTTHYLVKYWPIPYTILDSDRRQNGDYFTKPTQFWFINCEPKGNIFFEPIEQVEYRTVNGYNVNGVERTRKRSEMHPQYARRFIMSYIAD